MPDLPISRISIVLQNRKLPSDADFFASLPVPEKKADPAKWKWSAETVDAVKNKLGIKQQLYERSEKSLAVIPKSKKHPFEKELSVGPLPKRARGHGGMTYVNWTFGTTKLCDLSMDVTFHSQPRPPASAYLQLYDFKIGQTGQYFGFQYSWNRGKLKTQFIWSRWKTRDKANAKVATGGWIESAGYEGDFVGIRYPLPIKQGMTYTIHLAIRETDRVGTWYEMKLYEHQSKKWVAVGRLRFPANRDDSLPMIADGGGSWTEIYGGTKSTDDIAPFHLSHGGVYTLGRTVKAKTARISYSENAHNSDVSFDPQTGRVHVAYGGKIRRRTKKRTFDLSELTTREPSAKK